MKKFVSMLLALVMVFALCACGSKTEDGDKAESIKVGFICLHDENSTYDKNFIDAAKAACKNAGLSEDQYIIKTNMAARRSGGDRSGLGRRGQRLF